MTYEAKDMTGSMFVNDKREKDSHPNVKGSCVIDGVAYWMDAWTKTTGEGKKWQSVAFKKKEKQDKALSPRANPPAPFDDMDSDIPF